MYLVKTHKVGHVNAANDRLVRATVPSVFDDVSIQNKLAHIESSISLPLLIQIEQVNQRSALVELESPAQGDHFISLV